MLRAVNGAARRGGLACGQRHADARAILPALASAPAEPEGERAALARLGRWCARWSPLVALDEAGDGTAGLLIDITGVAHLFDGEAALIADMRRRLAAAGVPARLALAGTVGAAWGLARFGDAVEAVIPSGGESAALAALPVAALRIGEAMATRARRLGLKRIGDLAAMPRAGLARRFRDGEGLTLVRRLDQALGIEPEPLACLGVPPRHAVRAACPEPLLDADGISTRLAGLASALAADLERAGLGARALTLSAWRTDGRVETLAIRLGRPGRAPAVWRRLFGEAGLGRIDPGFGIDALALRADIAEPLGPAQATLDGEAEAAGERLAALVDRLAARLGARAVRIARERPSWLPERAARWLPAQGAAMVAREEATGRPRPLVLLDPPEPVETVYAVPEGAPAQFRWRRVLRRVTRAEGPERIEPEWWRMAGRRRALRDYYRVEDDQGVRYWLYREGLFGREAEGAPAPSWWMHGLFG